MISSFNSIRLVVLTRLHNLGQYNWIWRDLKTLIQWFVTSAWGVKIILSYILPTVGNPIKSWKNSFSLKLFDSGLPQRGHNNTVM